MKWKILALVAACAAVPAQAEAQSRASDGLSKIELLALQQEMRDRGCGNRRAPGVMNAETRRAIRTCSQRLGVTGGARALLAAFNNGFASNDGPPPARNDRAPVMGELGTHPVRAGEANRATPATPATRAVPARDGQPATRAVPATRATPARPASNPTPRDSTPKIPG
jgi:hypothetical protein